VTALALVLGVAWCVLQVLVFIRPPSDPVEQADVIVVLGGNQAKQRVRFALNLGYEFPKSTLLLSVYPSDCPRDGTAAKVICFQPRPFSTQGEAQYASQYARAHNAKSMLVITTADQTTRVRIRFSRCWSGRLAVHNVYAPLRTLISRIPYENAATAKALIWQRSC
jgi:uncharacterized SAM-binding protein YcdF (DUF218 family)